MTRRVATAVVALLLPVPLLAATAPAYADRPVTGEAGTPDAPTEATCEPGGPGYGIGVWAIGGSVFAARLYCSPSQNPTATVGGTDGAEAYSGCLDSDYDAIGLYGTALNTGTQSDGISSLGVICAGPGGEYQGPAVGDGGGSAFAVRCPTGTFLNGIRGTPSFGSLASLQGLCAVPTTTTVAITDSGPSYPGETVTLESTTTPDVEGYDAPTGLVNFTLSGPPDQATATTVVGGKARTEVRLGTAPQGLAVYYGGDASNLNSYRGETIGSDVLTVAQGPGPSDPNVHQVVSCPLGTKITRLDWSESDSTGYLRGVRLRCSDGSASEYAGGLTDAAVTTATSCLRGDDVVGLHTRTGAIVDAAAARCGVAGSRYDATYGGNAESGSPNEPTHCPAGAVLLGLTVDWGEFNGEEAVYGLQGICGDSTAPVVRVRPVPAVTLGVARPASWSGSDVLTGVEGYLAITQRTVSTSTPRAYEYVDRPGGSRGSVTVRNLRPGQTACVHVSATDGAGNVSDRTRGVCTSRPFDERAATASKGWTRAKNRSAYLRTTMVSRTKGATLSLRTVGLSRVGVVATTCPTCGSLTVLAGSRTLGTIDLRSATTRHQRVLLLPARTTPAGVLRLRVASSGKPVTVDGIVATAVYKPVPG